MVATLPTVHCILQNSDLPEEHFDTLVQYRTYKEYDSVQQTLPEQEKDGFLKRFMQRRSIELNTKYKSNQLEAELAKTFISNFPKVFFLLLPVFAGLLKLLYIRRDYYYSEHLVFSTIFYNFFFLNASIGMVVSDVPWLDWLTIVAYSWIPLCLLVAMRVMYGQGWMKTILKYFLFLFMFAFSVVIGLMINLFVTILQI